MAEASLEQAREAAKAREYEKALELYSQVVESAPSAEVLTGRAQVHNKLKNFMEAAADAAQAIELDGQLATAHRERGMALYNLDEFESAMDAFQAAADLEPSKQIHKTWVNMCRVQLGEELPPPPSRPYEPPRGAGAPLGADGPSTSGSAAGSGGESQGQGITLSGDQLKAFLQQAQAAGNLGTALGGGRAPPPPEEEEQGTEQPKHVTVDDPEFSKYWKAPAAAAAVPDRPAGVKYRHQWFQSPERVEVDVLAKGLKKEAVGVTIEAQRLRVVTIGADGQQEYDLDLPLAGVVVPEESRFEVLGTKVEIKLKKAAAGQQWPSLELSGTAGAPAAAAAAPAAAAPAAAPGPAGPTPVYPYAGKKVDWDKFAEEVKKEEKEEKLEGDQALMKFFRELYEGGDDDTRRAMVKSMQESGGTALSMNWSDVGRKDYSKKGKGGDDSDDDDFGRPSRP